MSTYPLCAVTDSPVEANVSEKAQEQSQTINSLRANSRDNFELSSKRVRAGADEIASLTSTLLDSVSKPCCEPF